MKKFIEIGSVFGYLTVIEYLGAKNYNNIYLCKCTCGKTREVKLTGLLTKEVNNCGCKNFVSKKHANQKYSPEEASYRAKASNYISHAKKRNIEYTLSYDEFISLLKGNCFYCNKPPLNKYNARSANRINKKNKVQYSVNNAEGYEVLYNGVDRIDNDKGYIQGNVVSCCTQCNTAKLSSSLDDFKKWIINVYNNLNLKDYENSSCV
jgi:hypothetical protein